MLSARACRLRVTPQQAQGFLLRGYQNMRKALSHDIHKDGREMRGLALGQGYSCLAQCHLLPFLILYPAFDLDGFLPLSVLPALLDRTKTGQAIAEPHHAHKTDAQMGDYRAW